MNGLQIDINTGDLLVERSAAVVADASGFIAELVLRSCRGEFKEHPLLGAEAPLMLAGEPDPFWPGNAKKMLRACGLDVSNLTLSPDGVVQSVDAPSIYKVPLMMHAQGLDQIVLHKVGIAPIGDPDLGSWRKFLDLMDSATEKVTIGLVGKYVELQDAYKSINEALFQAATYCGRKLDLRYIHSEDRGVSKVSSWPSNGAGHTTSPPSASVWACSAWSSSLPATCSGSPRPTRPRWLPTPPTTSST